MNILMIAIKKSKGKHWLTKLFYIFVVLFSWLPEKVYIKFIDLWAFIYEIEQNHQQRKLNKQIIKDLIKEQLNKENNKHNTVS